MFTERRTLSRVAVAVMMIFGGSASADVGTNPNTNTITNTNTNTQTRTCTVNWVPVDCNTGVPLPQPGGTQADLCPSMRYDFQYGRDCTYRVANLQYKAVKLSQTYSDTYFPAGSKLTYVGHLNDAYKLAAQAIGFDGKRYGVEIQLSDNASNFYYTLLGTYGLESRGGSVDNYGNVVGGSRLTATTRSKSASFAGGGSSYLATDASIFGTAGFLHDVKSSSYPYPIQQRVGQETIADGSRRGVFWSDEGYPSTPSSHIKAVLGELGDTSAALAVSGDGIAAGSLRKAGATRVDAIQWSPKSSTHYVLSGLGGDASAQDVNNNVKRMVVGFAKRTDGYRFAAKWTDNVLAVLPSLQGTGDPSDIAYAVTDAKDVVGSSFGRAVIWRDNAVKDLNSALVNTLGTTLTVARQINRQGLIIAFGADSNYYVLLPTDHIK